MENQLYVKIALAFVVFTYFFHKFPDILIGRVSGCNFKINVGFQSSHLTCAIIPAKGGGALIECLSSILFQSSVADVFWDFVRFFLFPAVVAFGVSKYNIYHASKTRRLVQKRSILRFYKALLETDLPILKNYLTYCSGDSLPMPLAPLPIKISLSDLTMSHEENQFMADLLAQQLILRSQFLGKAVLGTIDRKSVTDYYHFTQQSLALLHKMLGDSLQNTNNKDN